MKKQKIILCGLTALSLSQPFTLSLSAISLQNHSLIQINQNLLTFENLKTEIISEQIKSNGLRYSSNEFKTHIHTVYFSNLDKTQFNEFWKIVLVKINQRSGGFWNWLKGTYYCAMSSSSFNCGQPHDFGCRW